MRNKCLIDVKIENNENPNVKKENKVETKVIKNKMKENKVAKKH